MVGMLAKMTLCLTGPMILMMFFVKGGARKQLLFLVLGFCCAACSGSVNNYVGSLMKSYNEFILTSYYAPFVEECIKTIPVIIYCIFFRSRSSTDEMIMTGMCVGVGFGMLENSYYLMTNISKISSIYWIFGRGFATALMHALCTAMVGYLLGIALDHRRMYITGPIAALSMAVTYHSIYNILVKTDYRSIVIFMPIITFAGLLIFYRKMIMNNDSKRSKYEEII